MDHARLLINGNDDCNLTGAGIGVAVLDTGCAPHPDLSGQIGAFCDILGHRVLPYDDNGHGTHVCGIIAGNGSLSDGRFRGIAPGCTLIPVKVLDRQGSGRARMSSPGCAGFASIRNNLAFGSSISLSARFPEEIWAKIPSSSAESIPPGMLDLSSLSPPETVDLNAVRSQLRGSAEKSSRLAVPMMRKRS